MILIRDIADSRFQEQLLKDAQSAGKIGKDYRIPDYARNNRPERLKELLTRYRAQALFPEFPFGTDLTAEEVVLRKALQHLKQTIQRKKWHFPRLEEISRTIAVPHDASAYLERMALDQPKIIKEKMLRRALVYALVSEGAI